MAATGAVLGTMTWGPTAQVNLAEATKQLEVFVARGGRMIDTARMYQFGQTEELIGELLEQRPDLASKIEIHTKAHPLFASLTAEGVQKQLDASLKALRVKSVAIFYLHQPDIKVPLLETLKACDEQFRLGKFKELGLSNYAAWDVVYAHLLCEQHKLAVRPTVYQGLMNAVNHSMDNELIPALRTLNMRCYVFNPLAGGLLTGRYTSVDQLPETGRFSKEFDFVPKSMENHPFKGKAHQLYRARYWNADMFAALEVLRKACTEDKLSMPEAAIAWVLKKSTLRLDKGDGLIFGASSVAQVESNMNSVDKAFKQELSDEVLSALKTASDLVTPEPYFRGYDQELGKATEYLAKF